jgi:hypothetical protein
MKYRGGTLTGKNSTGSSDRSRAGFENELTKIGCLAIAAPAGENGEILRLTKNHDTARPVCGMKRPNVSGAFGAVGEAMSGAQSPVLHANIARLTRQ